jgi:predicted AAA+ superfamily ATPase
MKRLLENAFLRFERKSQQGLFRLTQAMGGGKTHTMLVLGLLAKNPKSPRDRSSAPSKSSTRCPKNTPSIFVGIRSKKYLGKAARES